MLQLVRDNIKRAPQYQSFGLLLGDIHHRLTSFICAQSLLYKSETAHAICGHSLAFDFDGEFSVVADPAGGEIASRIESLRRALGQALGLRFWCVVFTNIWLTNILICLQGSWQHQH